MLILFKRRYKGEHVSCLDLRLDLSVQLFFLEAKMEAISYVRVVVVVVFISAQEKNLCVIKKNFEKYQKGEKFNATSACI